MENPRGSRAWKLPWVRRVLYQLGLKLAVFEPCRFGLTAVSGELHQKPTCLATSSQAVVSTFLGVKCKRDHGDWRFSSDIEGWSLSSLHGTRDGGGYGAAV